MINIIKEQAINGYPKLALYLVEAEPTRQLIFFRDGAYSDTISGALEIPLPRSLYVVRAVKFKKDGTSPVKEFAGVVTHMYAIENDGKPVNDETEIYLLPWPNYYYNGMMSICSARNILVPDGATKEQVLEDTIIKNWAITFGYMGYTTPAHKWLLPDSSLINKYKKWEKLTLEQAAKIPWGKHTPGITYGRQDGDMPTVGKMRAAIMGVQNNYYDPVQLDG